MAVDTTTFVSTTGAGLSSVFQVAFSIIIGTIAGIDEGMKSLYSSLPTTSFGIPKSLLFVAAGWAFGAIFFAWHESKKDSTVARLLFELLGRPIALASTWAFTADSATGKSPISFTLFFILAVGASVGWQFLFGAKLTGKSSTIAATVREKGLVGLPREVLRHGKEFLIGSEEFRSNAATRTDSALSVGRQLSSAIKGQLEQSQRKDRIVSTFEKYIEKTKKANSSKEAGTSKNIDYTKVVSGIRKALEDQTSYHRELHSLMKGFKNDYVDRLKEMYGKSGIRELSSDMEEVEKMLDFQIKHIGDPANITKDDVGDLLNKQLKNINLISEGKSADENEKTLKSLGKDIAKEIVLWRDIENRLNRQMDILNAAPKVLRAAERKIERMQE